MKTSSVMLKHRESRHFVSNLLQDQDGLGQIPSGSCSKPLAPHKTTADKYELIVNHRELVNVRAARAVHPTPVEVTEIYHLLTNPHCRSLSLLRGKRIFA